MITCIAFFLRRIYHVTSAFLSRFVPALERHVVLLIKSLDSAPVGFDHCLYTIPDFSRA